MEFRYYPFLSVSRFSQYSVQIVQVVSDIKHPATIEDIFEEVYFKYKPQSQDLGFWENVEEKLDMALERGYIQEFDGLYTVVRPLLPTVDELLLDDDYED